MKVILIGKPIAKMRARHSSRGNYVVTYDPQQEAKESVRLRFMHALQEALNSEVRSTSQEAYNLSKHTSFIVSWKFYLPIPESDSIASKNSKLWGFELPNCKPDYDNLEKFYLDCANGILWPDDRMIVKASAEKKYSVNPRIEVIIMPKQPISLPSKAEGVIKCFSPDQLKMFLSDIKDLTELDPENIACDGETPSNWLIKAAQAISNFSLKYASVLKKVEKLGSVAEEIDHLSECKAALLEGKYAV